MIEGKSKRRIFYLSLFLVACLGLYLRLQFSPDMNYETDSFVTLLSAKSISETGQYKVPPVRLTDSPGGYQSHPGWAVGYPLLLSLVFSLFGYGEEVARWATILICSSVIPVTGMVARRLGGEKAGLAAALLVAINPLLVCINGRILTANLGYCFLSLSLSFLLLGTVREQGDAQFFAFEDLINSQKRLFYLSLSFLFFGFTLATRDDFAMFALPFLVIFWMMARMPHGRDTWNRLSDMAKLAGIGGFLFFVGLLPNLYYNYKTYGRILTSSHYEYGGRLSFPYFWEGARGALGLPGWAVMVFTIFVFAFPVVSVLFVRKMTKIASVTAAIILVMALPIILINGAYPVASSGASPRYVLPLIPFISIMAGMFIVQRKTISKLSKSVFLVLLGLWHVALFYPPPFLFTAFPNTAYLTQYSPWYNRNNFMNYPHPSRATVQWVKAHTPPDTIILSDYDSYNYYFYARRDVMDKEMIGEIVRQLRSRPIYFIDDHQSAVYGDSLNGWRTSLKRSSITLDAVDSIPLYSPARGEVRLKIYALTKEMI